MKRIKCIALFLSWILVLGLALNVNAAQGTASGGHPPDGEAEDLQFYLSALMAAHEKMDNAMRDMVFASDEEKLIVIKALAEMYIVPILELRSQRILEKSIAEYADPIENGLMSKEAEGNRYWVNNQRHFSAPNAYFYSRHCNQGILWQGTLNAFDWHTYQISANPPLYRHTVSYRGTAWAIN